MAILTLGILFFLAHALSLLFEKTAVPDVLVLMLMGIVAGPVLGIVSPESFGEVGETMSSIALVAILFEGGMSLDLQRLGTTVKASLPVFLSTFLGSMALGALAGVFLLKLPLLPSLTFGCIIASISPAVALPLAKTLKLERSTTDRLTIETSLTDVFSIILVFTFTSAVGGANISVGRMLGSILSSLIFAAVIGLVASYVWLRMLSWVRKFPNTNLATFFFLFIVFGVSDFLGFSGAIASLAFGLGVANKPFAFVERMRGKELPPLSSIAEGERSFFDEIIFLLKTFFFVYLGISMRFASPVIIALGLGLVVAIYLLRFFSVRQLLPRETLRRDVRYSSIMAPKGLASAVLAGLPLAAGMAGAEEIRDAAYIIVFFSIVLTAALVTAFERTRLAGHFDRLLRGFPAPIRPVLLVSPGTHPHADAGSETEPDVTGKIGG